jgi:hypothetical protein
LLIVLLSVLIIGLPVPDIGGRRAPGSWQQQRKVLQVSPQQQSAKPRLPPLRQPRIANVLIQGDWELDGLNCVGCRFRNASLHYSGGSFRCTQCWIEDDLTIVFSGAAVNVLAVRGWLNVRNGAGAANLPLPNVSETVHLKMPLKVDLVSPSLSP